jgi:hypothetical protein
MNISEDQIKQWLEKWQKRLGLLDWKISICFRDAQDMNHYPAKARIQERIQHVDMRILSCEDRQKSDNQYNDVELDIVHELIHVRIWALERAISSDNETLEICTEQAIEWIAKALIFADREDNENN